MAKKFSAKEKEIIQGRLLSKAEECWGRNGIKKTSVDELARMAGISKGAFYLFYPSKEQLFFEVLISVDKRIKNAMLEALTTSNEPPKLRLIHGLKQMFTEVEKSPWILNLQNGDYDLLLQKLPEETINEHLSDDEAEISMLLEVLNIECDAGFVSSVMKSIFLTVLHKNEISREHHEEVVHFFIESLADRMFEGRQQQ